MRDTRPKNITTDIKYKNKEPKTYCRICSNHMSYCSCQSPEVEGVEVFFTANDYSPSHKVRVLNGDITLLYSQDIWPGYEPAKIIDLDMKGYFEKGGAYYERIIRLASYGKKAKLFPRTKSGDL